MINMTEYLYSRSYICWGMQILISHPSKRKIAGSKCNSGRVHCIVTAYNGESDFIREIQKSILEEVIFELRPEGNKEVRKATI